MKNTLIATTGAVLALCMAFPASAITIELNPTSQAVNVGSTTTVDFVISGLGNGTAPSLGTFDLDLSFDSSILNFSGATFGNQLDLFGLGSLQFATVGTGTVNLFELSFDSADDLDTLQSASFLLASLSFDALASGSSALNISVNALGDSLGEPLDAEVIGGTIKSVGDVSPVPEPASRSLIGIGLLSMIALVMRRNRKIMA